VIESPSAPDAKNRLIGLLDDVAGLTQAHDRADLSARLLERRDALRSDTFRVLIAGDFKQGKSTLVNALVGADICPSDPDFATSVPTLIRYGRDPSATLLRLGEGDEAIRERIEVAGLGRWVSERDGADADRDQVRSCEIELPTTWLGDGIELVDMPGYGGLDAMAGARMVAELHGADAVLFVTDASQELTAPELDLLRSAAELCPLIAVVMTKIDLYIDWRVIRDVNIEHMRRIALDVPVVAVSALQFLRWTDRGRPELAADGGIDELIGHIRDRMMQRSIREQLAVAAGDGHSALRQLRSIVVSEREALDPQQQAGVVNDLRNTLRELAEARLDSASWHRMLRDRCEDLRLSTLDRIEELLAELRIDAQRSIAEHDPAAIWQEFESWMRARATRSVGEVYSELAEEASSLEANLVRQLAATPSLGAITTHHVASPLAARHMAGLTPGSGDSASTTAIDKSWSAAEPLLGVGAFIPGFGPVSLAVAAVAGLVYGRKALRDRRAQALGARREQAREHLEDYLTEVQRVVAKPAERYVSQLYRTLRDGVLRRTDEVERSTSEALARATAAATTSQADRVTRSDELTSELQVIDQLDRRFEDMVREMSNG
jgi:hypothetical protein